MALSIKGISKIFYKRKSFFAKTFSSVEALKGITLSIDSEKIYGIVGESGCGKTTLAKIIVGLLKPDSGEVCFNNQVVIDAGTKRRRMEGHSFQLVFQNPFTSLNPRFTINQILREGLINKKIDDATIGQKIESIAAEVNLPHEVIKKYPHELSGGERQRIALARALIVEPKLLILDEPLSSLDVTIQSSILLLIEKLVKKRSIIVLFIAHDLAVMRHIAEYVFVLSNGALVEEGPVETIFSTPQHHYTKRLLDAALYK